MTPEQHRDAAAASAIAGTIETAKYHATMAVAEALLQFDTCGHGTRGFCKDCVRNEFLQYPIQVRDIGKS